MEYVVDDLFSIFECFDDVIETIPAQAKINQTIYEISKNFTEESALIRLLTGAAIFECKKDKLKLRQNINYFILGSPKNFKRKISGYKNLFNDLEIDTSSLNNVLRLSATKSTIYKSLLLETLHFFHKENLGQHTLAFLHIYRFLERICFFFPLSYATASNDYLAAFSELKNYFDDKGELGFFNKFVETVLDTTLIDSETKFNLSLLEARFASQTAEAIRSSLSGDSIVSDTPNEIVVKNKALLKLLITLRNRFFHQSSSHFNHLTLMEISDPDRFFSVVNQKLFGWLAVIYYIILKQRLDKL